MSGLERAGSPGTQASGRNGGIAAASLTHGFGNGAARWPEELADLAASMSSAGYSVEMLDRSAVQAEVASPSYLCGLWDRGGEVVVEPARLAWGLRRTCLDLGVLMHEATPVLGLARTSTGMEVCTTAGRIRSRDVALATNAFPPLLRRLRLMTVPVYDHGLMTQPATSRCVRRQYS